MSNNNQSPRRSIFDNLHKKYPLYDEPKPTKTVISTNGEPISIEMNQGEGVRTMYKSANGHAIFVNGDVGEIGSQSTGRECSRVLPFTQKLKLMTTQSPAGSLPQQLPTDQTSNYHGNHIVANQISPDPIMAERPPYTPLYGQSLPSSSGPVSLHLHNGGLGNLSLSRNDVFLVLDPQTKFVKANYNKPVHTGHYILPTEQYPTSQQTSYSMTSGYPHESVQAYPRGYGNGVISTNHNAHHSTSPHIRREGHSLYSQPPPYSNVWESRPAQPIMTSPIHSVSSSSPFTYTNQTSAFSSPASAVSYQSQRSRTIVESRNAQRLNSPRLQTNGLEPRSKEQLRVMNSHPHDTSVNVKQQTRKQHSTSNDSFPKTFDHVTISDRLFRPVSPPWNQALYSNTLVTSTNNTRLITNPTEADKDEFSYACALHESANSPDIERMLGAESPGGRTSISSPSAESPNDKIEDKSANSVSPDSDVVREKSNHSDFSPNVPSEGHKKSRSTKSSDDSSQSSDCNATSDSKKKRKLSLNVIHKRLEPKLPSPVREVTSGDLFQDPSKLTREERALQRAMMMFSEMEMKEKVVKKKEEVKTDEPVSTMYSDYYRMACFCL